MKLINSKTGKEIKVGDKVTTFRGEKMILTGISLPGKRTRGGRVELREKANDLTGFEYFPSVIGAEFDGEDGTGALLEKVIVRVYPMNDQAKPYEVTFEHTAPNFIARKLAEQIEKLLRQEYIAEGVENIKSKM